MGDRTDQGQAERADRVEGHDDELVDFFSQAFFACSASGYDAGEDGEDPTAIAPPERFEVRPGWPPVNRSKWRAFTRQMLTLLADRRAYLAKTSVSRALEEEPSELPPVHHAS